MDRGRIIDNAQNTNARFIDTYGTSQKTSVRTTNPPGGKSSFSLGWSEPEPKVNKRITNNYSNNTNINPNINTISNPNINSNYNSNVNPSVNYNYDNNFQPATNNNLSGNVKYAPGGASNIFFGNDTTSMDDYRKNGKKK